MRHLSTLLLFFVPLASQPIRFGLRAGVPAGDSITADPPYKSPTQRYVAGGAIEMSLPYGLSGGADLLFQAATLGITGTPSRATAHRWELPLLLSYHAGKLPLRPFVRAGLSFNRVFDAANAADVAELRHRGTHGPVAAAGLQFRFGRIHLEPEVRITRWIDRNFGVRDSAVRSSLTQIEILAGLTF